MQMVSCSMKRADSKKNYWKNKKKQGRRCFAACFIGYGSMNLCELKPKENR